MAEREVKLRFEAEGAERVSTAIKKIGTSSVTTARQTQQLARAGTQVSTAMKQTTQSLLLLPGALVNTGRLLRATTVGLARSIGAFLGQADSVLDARAAFTQYGNKIGDATKLLVALQTATGKEVDALSLQQAALKFAAGGVELSNDQFGLLFKTIKEITDATGQELVPILSTVGRSFASLRLSTLAQVLGIEKLSNKQLAAKLGIQDLNQELSASQFQTAALTLIQQRAIETTEIFGKQTENLGDAAARTKAAFTDLRNDFAASFAINQELGKSLSNLGLVLGGVGKEGESVGTRLGTAFANAATIIANVVTAITLTIKATIFLAQGLIADFAGFARERVEAFDEIFGTQSEAARNLFADLEVGFRRAADERQAALEESIAALRAARDESANAPPLDVTLNVNVRGEIERTAQRVGERAGDEVRTRVQRLLEEAALADAAAAATP